MWFCKKSKKDNIYQIEYYPESYRYFVTFNGKYLNREFNSGVVRYALHNEMSCASNFTRRDDALKLINQHKEQQNKDLIKIETIY